MKYFKDITDIEQAKLRYRKLAKQLHPDKGGTALEFQRMQDEYKELIKTINGYKSSVRHSGSVTSPENELFEELRTFAKVLIRKQVPQKYLRQKMQASQSSFKKDLFRDIADLLDCM